MMIKDLLLCSIVLDDKLLSVLTTWLIHFFHCLFKTIKLGIIYLSVIDYKWSTRPLKLNFRSKYKKIHIHLYFIA